MRRNVICLLSIIIAGIAVFEMNLKSFADESTKPKTHEVQLNGHVFTLPVGFEIELAAGPPLVDRPITADFDEQGRLYVSDSSGSNDNVDEQLKKKPHRILRLEAENGKFVRRTIFADHMMFPEGTMWHAGSLYVAAPPSIWKLTDTQGDGVANQRVEWFQGKTLTRCANDLHGPYLGPDGWIYWCKGAFAQQTYQRPGRPPLVTKAAHIFRCRPDGTGIEPVMTGGMDNPVHVVFTPGGERIFTTTFLQFPGGGLRDGLIHAVYGGIYGKDHDVIYDHPWTGPSVMPVMTHLGAAAPCGLVRYESSVFGKEYQDNLFACFFNMHKLTRHVLIPDGATFKTQDSDFLVSNNLDFHPTHILEDADGSLLVIDTGGWYKLCCPTSQLHKPDVLGAIYRIRRTDAPVVEDPRGLKLDCAKLSAKDLANLLDDSRPAVRRRAVQTLAEKGSGAIPSLQETKSRSVEARRNAVWTATRINDDKARAFVRDILIDDPNETVRQCAIHSVSIWRDREALAELITLLRCNSLPNGRAAAEALGRIGDDGAIAPLLVAAGEVDSVAGPESSKPRPSQRVLEHSLIFALVEIAGPKLTATGLDSSNPRIRRAALIALDQMKNGNLASYHMVREFNRAGTPLRETAWWIAGRHPEWGTNLAGFFRERLGAKDISAKDKEELIRRMARFTAAVPVQLILTELLQNPAETSATKRLVLHAMAESKQKKVPDSWLTTWTSILSGEDQEQIAEVVQAIRALANPKEPAKSLVEPLMKICRNEKLPAMVRLSALAAVPGGLPDTDDQTFVFLRSQLNGDLPAATRSLAAETLAHAHLSEAQLLDLAQTLKTVGPLELDRLIEAFSQNKEEKLGLELIAALKSAPARSSLRMESLKQILAKYPASVQAQAKELYAALDADKAQQLAKLDQLLAGLKKGDIRRGQLVFNSTKASCSACHAIGYLGGNVGPDLTRIGQIRSERDLLESIVFPSVSIVRSYEPVLVTTKAGKTVNGLIRKESSEEITLATGVNQEVRISRKDIEDFQPSSVSIMPAGLDQQLSPQDLADLVAFLKACR